MSNWQSNFQSYTTSVAFQLQLTQVQVKAIFAIGDGSWAGAGFHMFYATAQALERKGLVEFNPTKNWPNSERRDWIYRLTPAGSTVMALLVLAGVAPARADGEQVAA